MIGYQRRCVIPYSIRKSESKFKVVNTESGDVKGVHDSKEKAEKQISLLRGVEHGWKPSK